jgi:cation diffusion facilitator CzcD-associated flavoprotein CzcO
MKHVAVIGAGPSGITAIKNFNDAGFKVTAFERCSGVGGNWRFNDPSGHSSVFETTHIISSKYTSFMKTILCQSQLLTIHLIRSF